MAAFAASAAALLAASLGCAQDAVAQAAAVMSAEPSALGRAVAWILSSSGSFTVS